MNHHLVALSRGKIQTRRKYAHGEIRFIHITEYLALILNNRVAALKTAQDIKAFIFIMTISGTATAALYFLANRLGA